MTIPSPVKSSLPLFFTDEMLSDRQYPTVFVYGIAGQGKTNIFGSVKHLSPLVLFTEDGQTKGSGTLGHLHIAAILVNSLDELKVITTDLSAKSKPGELYYGGHGPFGCLGLDSATGVGPMLEDASKKNLGWEYIWDGVGRKDPRQAYPYIAERGRDVIRKLMALPVPLIITAREQLVTEETGAVDERGRKLTKSYPAPELPGAKLPRELPGWPEATLRLRTLNGVRVMVTQNEGDVVARVRLREGLRCDKFVKPDIGAMIRLLQGDESALADLKLEDPKPTPKTPQQLAAEEAARKRTEPVTQPTTTKP